MINAEVKVKFNFNEREGKKLVDTLFTLESIREEFEKCGLHNETEIKTLEAAEHIIDEIIRGETF